MIKISVFYPNTDGATFDMDYYTGTHMSMVRSRLGAACKQMNAEKGLVGGAPDAPPAYIAMGHIILESMESFQNHFAPNIAEFVADIPNFTNTQPTLQISEIAL